MFHFKLAAICVLGIWASCVKGDHGNQGLAARILSDYDMRVVPGFTTVKLRITLKRIIDLDTTKKVLSLDTWFQMDWEDDRLAWDEDEEFENISHLALPAKSLWIPDITLYNSADGYTEFNKEIRAVVDKRGKVVFIPQTKFNSICDINDTYTGYGNVTCSLKFGSWVYNGNELDLRVAYEGWDTFSFFDYNQYWKYVDSSFKRNLISYQCCPETFVDITFLITLQPV